MQKIIKTKDVNKTKTFNCLIELGNYGITLASNNERIKSLLNYYMSMKHTELFDLWIFMDECRKEASYSLELYPQTFFHYRDICEKLFVIDCCLRREPVFILKIDNLSEITHWSPFNGNHSNEKLTSFLIHQFN